MRFKVKKFEELSVGELYEILKLRAMVFVVEQNCVYNDLDGLDAQALHVNYYSDEKTLIGYARILPENTRYTSVSIGRVVISPNYRGKLLGKELMQKSVEYIQENWKVHEVCISAQQHLEKFYSSIGFETVSDMYHEDGIPHLKMKITL